MSEFNHEKAYFVWVIPAWINLNDRQIKAHMKLNPIVKDLVQGGNFDIPMSDDIKVLFDRLNIEEIAVLSRVSGKVEPLFEMKAGESWKISNLCDQILRERLEDLPHNIEIHKGVLQVTYSSHNCWMFEEFGLAIEKNIAAFYTFKKKHYFSGENFHNSANKLKMFIGDLWLCYDVDAEADTEEYQKFLEMKKQNRLIQAKKDKVNELERLRQNICDAEIKYYAIKWLINHNIPYDNWIYYSHKKEFCWGWRNPISEQEIKKHSKTLKDFPYPFTIKKEEI
jgi:hypothetical protein